MLSGADSIQEVEIPISRNLRGCTNRRLPCGFRYELPLLERACVDDASVVSTLKTQLAVIELAESFSRLLAAFSQGGLG